MKRCSNGIQRKGIVAKKNIENLLTRMSSAKDSRVNNRLVNRKIDGLHYFFDKKQ